LILQDQVVLTAQETNSTVESILEYDMLSFESLHASCIRLRAQHTRETAWISMMAAQGSVKGMKKMEKSWVRLSELDLAPAAATDAAKFLRRIGKGI